MYCTLVDFLCHFVFSDFCLVGFRNRSSIANLDKLLL